MCWRACILNICKNTLKIKDKTSWSCAGVNLSAKARFDCGWIMWLASKHVLTVKTNFAFCTIKIRHKLAEITILLLGRLAGWWIHSKLDHITE